MHDNDLDGFDRRILALLQGDSSLTSAELSQKVNLSASQCSRRKSALEDAGYIEGYGARLNARKLGFTFKAIARVNLKAHGEASASSFATFLSRHDIVRAAYSVSGDADYVLEIVTRGLDEYAAFIHQHLLPHPQVGQVRSDIVLMTMKDDPALPLIAD